MARVSLAGLAALAAAGMMTAGFASGASAQAVNVYTTRTPDSALPLLTEFSAQTGVAVNTIYVVGDIAARITAEGATSPADLILADFTALADLAEQGLTQPVTSAALAAAVPEQLRDPASNWFALSMGATVIYAAADRVDNEALTYEDLASPEWAGRICMRSGLDPMNVALFSAYLAKHGEDETAAYISDLQLNLAREAGGDDRDAARDLAEGICDVAIGNTTTLGLMHLGLGGPIEQEWAAAIRPIFATFDDGAGTLPAVTGAALAANAPHPEQAIMLLEFLSSAAGQDVFAIANFEYPIDATIALEPLTAGFGEFIPDPTPLAEIGANRGIVRGLVEAAGFDG
ncbi:MAG: extracellular solute-binding protein [Bauldia sp.]